jgi:predicted DNA binding CopG/RHH family protein
MTARAKRPKAIVHDWSEVPALASEAAEAEFWATHQLADSLLDQMETPPVDLLPPPRPRTRPVGIRFDEFTLKRIKALASRRHTGYQTLLKEFVGERLYEEEKREGII